VVEKQHGAVLDLVHDPVRRLQAVADAIDEIIEKRKWGRWCDHVPIIPDELFAPRLFTALRSV
jgi:hypothetical protein